MFDDVARQVLLAVVLTTLLARAPSLLRGGRNQRPLLLVLAVFAASSVLVQPWFGAWVNDVTGIVSFNNLLQGVWGIVDITATLSFVVHLTGSRPLSGRRKLVWGAWASASGFAMIALFAVTSPEDRFTSSGESAPFAAYALVAAAYMVGAAGTAAWLLWRHLPAVRGGPLRPALTMILAGDLVIVPFMAIRTVERLTPIPSWLPAVAVALSTIRFVLFPLGCVIVALEPFRTAAVHRYRRIRLYSLWRSLRASTPELSLTPVPSRARDLFDTGDAWESLHRRVIEIRDSIFQLYDTRVWGELLDHARTQAPPGDPELSTIACWLEVARRTALGPDPKLHQNLDKSQLPELLADSTLGHETRYFLELHRVLRSAPVREFADRFAGTSAPVWRPGERNIA
ncbi:MAB_1171c family putative transporter [Amycolatopsis sp. lyj-112]|uniref:MAB_1171c family putative transporter n=1 Tax=Amycolatopsis sp. lyj-112 TaxID=2789288 RepID=UPI00397AD8E2